MHNAENLPSKKYRKDEKRLDALIPVSNRSQNWERDENFVDDDANEASFRMDGH